MTSFPERGWERPELVGWGRLETRSPLVPYSDLEAALRGSREESPNFSSLDGRWRFTLVDRPEAAPADFATPNFQDANWSFTVVPGNWTRQH